MTLPARGTRRQHRRWRDLGDPSVDTWLWRVLTWQEYGALSDEQKQRRQVYKRREDAGRKRDRDRTPERLRVKADKEKARRDALGEVLLVRNKASKYGLTVEEFYALLDRQDWRCLLCPNKFDLTNKRGRGAAHVDHDHATGKVRGILCSGCNLGIGHFHEDVERMKKAIEYIQNAGVVRSSLGDNATDRKNAHLHQAIRYFHDALAEVGRVIEAGQSQHGTNGWDRAKSGDEIEALLRHVVDAGYTDTDGQLHSAKVGFRALANLQKEIEAVRGLPLSVGSYDSSQEPRGLPISRGSVPGTSPDSSQSEPTAARKPEAL